MGSMYDKGYMEGLIEEAEHLVSMLKSGDANMGRAGDDCKDIMEMLSHPKWSDEEGSRKSEKASLETYKGIDYEVIEDSEGVWVAGVEFDKLGIEKTEAKTFTDETEAHTWAKKFIDDKLAEPSRDTSVAARLQAAYKGREKSAILSYEEEKTKEEKDYKQVQRDIKKMKSKIEGEEIHENMGDKEMRKLKDKYSDYMFGGRNKIYDSVQEFTSWCIDYTG